MPETPETPEENAVRMDFQTQSPAPLCSRSADSDRPPSRRRGPLLRSFVHAGLVSAAIVGVGGCTSMPFMPTSGAGGAFTLATADHVASREDALRRELLQQVERRIAVTVEAAREQDQARLEEIAERVEARANEVSDLVERLDRNEQALEEIATMLAERLDRLAEETMALRQQATMLQDEVRFMPAATLDRLRRAIDTELREVEREAELRETERETAEADGDGAAVRAASGDRADAPRKDAGDADGTLLRPRPAPRDDR